MDMALGFVVVVAGVSLVIATDDAVVEDGS